MRWSAWSAQSGRILQEPRARALEFLASPPGARLRRLLERGDAQIAGGQRSPVTPRLFADAAADERPIIQPASKSTMTTVAMTAGTFSSIGFHRPDVSPERQVLSGDTFPISPATGPPANKWIERLGARRVPSRWRPKKVATNSVLIHSKYVPSVTNMCRASRDEVLLLTSAGECCGESSSYLTCTQAPAQAFVGRWVDA